MNINIEQSWKKYLKDEFDARYFHDLAAFVRGEYMFKNVFPNPKRIFAAFDLCSLDNAKIVILGQDPYHGVDQANGLCFSVNDGVKVPPSLMNIYKEMEDDLKVKIFDKNKATSGNLEYLAKQGVLLLNATLTVEAHKAGSHQNKGWEEFTDAVIKSLSENKEGLVFMLWGRYAQKKGAIIDDKKHLVLSAPHPSPFSAHSGFFGCKHFSKANEYLKTNGKELVQWVL